MPTELTADTVCYCSNKFTAKSCKMERITGLVWSGDVPNSEAKTRANSSGLLCLSDMSHSN